jgi:hypothetical protein
MLRFTRSIAETRGTSVLSTTLDRFLKSPPSKPLPTVLTAAFVRASAAGEDAPSETSETKSKAAIRAWIFVREKLGRVCMRSVRLRCPVVRAVRLFEAGI